VATSGQDLLSEIARLTDVTHPDAALADQAITAVSHTARALLRLAGGNNDPRRPAIVRRQLVLRELGTVSRLAASRWAPVQGRLPDLAGAAADVLGMLGMRDPRLDQDSQWAAAVALSAVTRRCVEAATRFPPYARVPELVRLSRVAAIVAHVAALDPPRQGQGAILDMSIPAADLSSGLSPARQVAESAAGLVNVLERETRANVLHLYAALAASAAAESVARYSSALAYAPGKRQQRQRASGAWQLLQTSLIRFDDGSRYVSASPSSVTRWALHLTDGIERLPEAPRHASAADPDELEGIWFAAGQLGSIAAHIEKAMYRWAGDGKLFAKARGLPQSERHVRAVVSDRVVMATSHDLSDVVASARLAGHTSAELATDIQRSIVDRRQGRQGLDAALPLVERRRRSHPGVGDAAYLATSREQVAQRVKVHIAR
jgi:hypothetical protein